MLTVPHLDREFDYLVPAEQSDDAQPGVRVRVRFHGRLVDAFVLERRSDTDHVGKLGWLDRVVSAEPVLTPEVRRLVDAVAARYAGTRADVLRLAVPPRHAKVEKQTAPPLGPPSAEPGRRHGLGGLQPAASSSSTALRRAGPPARCGRRCPGKRGRSGWPRPRRSTVNAGRGVLAVVPDQRDVDALHAAAVRARGRADRVVALSAGLGPSARYRRWLAVLRGHARLVIGTRSAVFAPVADLGLVVVWDDGDDTLAEPRAPYPHAREVAMLRAHQLRCAAVIGGYARTAEAQALVRSGWAHDLVATRQRCARARRGWSRSTTAASPRSATRPRAPRGCLGGAARGAHGAGSRGPGAGAGAAPRLRAGAGVRPLPHRRALQALHRPAVAARPRRPRARCAGGAAATELALRCARCGSDAVRAVVVGARRTAEELGRAFPGTHRHHLRRRRRWSARCRDGPARGGRDAGRRTGRRRAVTAPRCCWTAGRCWAGRTCVPPRTRCGAGWRRPRWCAAAPTAAWWRWSPSRRSPPCRH